MLYVVPTKTVVSAFPNLNITPLIKDVHFSLDRYLEHPIVELFCNEVTFRILSRISYDLGTRPHDFVLDAVFKEIYKQMDFERNVKTSLWSDFTSSAKEKLMGFVAANTLIDIYKLAIMKQRQEMNAVVSNTLVVTEEVVDNTEDVVDNTNEVVVKERISISQKNGVEEDYHNSVPMSKRLPSKIPAKKTN